MKKSFLKKVIASILTITSLIILSPVSAHAEWKRNNNGWWYTEGKSYATGWKLIDGNWYYFYSNGYMAHDATINGYYLSSGGAWTESINDKIGQDILKNVSIKNPSFVIQCSNDEADFSNLENIINDEIDKLKISNSYEMFNVSNYEINLERYSSGKTYITINCTYKMTAEMEAQLDAKAREIVSDIAPDYMNTAQKERAIHDWIINNTRYDQSLSIYDPYNTLFKHTGVCEGYSLLAQKMFTIAGIKSIVVEGTADGESHAWNLVYINNKWRHVDLTWDDPVSYEDVLQHNYYNLTDKEISSDHSWDTSVYPSTN